MTSSWTWHTSWHTSRNLLNSGEHLPVAAMKFLYCVTKATFPPYFCEINLLSPGRYGSKFQSIIFKLIIQDSSWGTCCEVPLGRMLEKLTSDVSIGSAKSLTWRSVDLDLWRHMASLGHNQLIRGYHINWCTTGNCPLPHCDVFWLIFIRR